MNKLKKIFTIIFFFFLLYLLFRFNYILNKSVIDAVLMWLTKVFPSLFIMFIFNDFIIETNALEPLTKILSKPFNKLFHTTNASVEVFLLSMLSGTPTSTFIIKENLLKKRITLDDANKLLSFSYFSNPLFLYNILKLTFNTTITLRIIFFHYLANFIIGLFSSKEKTKTERTVTYPSNYNIFKLLPGAINKSFNTMLMILGTITFYMIISNLILNIFSLNTYGQIIVKGLLEITQSLNMLNNLNSLSIIKEIIAISIISFGGLSIHTQVLSLLSNTNIKYSNFFIGRLKQVLIATTTYLAFVHIF